MKRRSTVPRAQLVDTEHTSNKDNNNGQGEEEHEPLEPSVDASARDFAGFDIASVAESVLDRKDNEDEDDSDLER